VSPLFSRCELLAYVVALLACQPRPCIAKPPLAGRIAQIGRRRRRFEVRSRVAPRRVAHDERTKDVLAPRSPPARRAPLYFAAAFAARTAAAACTRPA